MKRLLSGLLVSLAAAASFSASAQSGISKLLCDNCATVQSVQQEERKGKGGVVGVLGGAVVGGLLGNQVGGGTGKTVATVGGAAAGAYAGNEIQKRVDKKKVWVTRVKLRDGSERSFDQEPQPEWRKGSIVRVSADGKTLSKF